MACPRRPTLERLAAWAVTGPPGHLWSALADIAVLLARCAWARARAREEHRRASGLPGA